jgi:uncharacterized protein YdeI (BOF family)
MKLRVLVYLFALIIISAACSDDKENKRKGDADVTHTGDKWNIASVDYMLIDQSTGGQTMKNGTKTNVGSFYFDGAKGSFEMELEGYHKEDVFSFVNNQGSVSITTIDQSVGGGTISQNVLSLSGDYDTDTQITLSGTIVKQSTTGQFVLTIENFTLVKL